MLNPLAKVLAITLTGSAATIPVTAHADITVMMSGGFALPYKASLPDFERATGIKVTTVSGASQGNGPNTIKAQLQKGAQADMVILSKEGVDELDAAGLIASNSGVGLATTPLAAAVRAGAAKPNISTVAAFKESMLKARLVSMPASTSGKYIEDNVFPRLGIANEVSVKVVSRGLESTKMLAEGESDIALGPVSELRGQPGIDLVATLPAEIQLIQTFTAAIVKGTKHKNEVKQLIAFLTSSKTNLAIRKAGMEPVASVAPGEIVKEIAPTGKLRAAINFGNPVIAQKDPVTGEPRGVSADLSRDLARRLGVPVEFIPFNSAGNVTEAGKAGLWDIAFLALDPERASNIAFTAPYVVIEGTYLVAKNSPLQTISDVDRKGVRVVVGKGSAYDLYLTRTIKSADIVRAPTSPSVFDVFHNQKLEVAAGVRQQLVAFASEQPNLRVMEGRFMVIEQAVAMPKGREAGLVFVKRFVEDKKAAGFVADALTRSHQPGADVAPPAQ